MANKDCSFCGKKAPEEIAESKLMSGKDAAICRSCVELMVEIFARKDERWTERLMFSLRGWISKK